MAENLTVTELRGAQDETIAAIGCAGDNKLERSFALRWLAHGNVGKR